MTKDMKAANLVLTGQVGADAKFFDLFDESTKANIFSKTFQLFKVSLVILSHKQRLSMPHEAMPWERTAHHFSSCPP
jgi:hypothetical protein